MLLIFGDSDPLNPVDGGPVRYGANLVLDKPPHRFTAGSWGKRFDCVISVRASMKAVNHRGWYGCADDVRVLFLTVQDLGHFWPGGPVKAYDSIPAGRVGPYQGRVNATAIIWDFFKQSARSGT